MIQNEVNVSTYCTIPLTIVLVNDKRLLDSFIISSELVQYKSTRCGWKINWRNEKWKLNVRNIKKKKMKIHPYIVCGS